MTDTETISAYIASNAATVSIRGACQLALANGRISAFNKGHQFRIDEATNGRLVLTSVDRGEILNVTLEMAQSLFEGIDLLMSKSERWRVETAVSLGVTPNLPGYAGEFA